ncbi:MAG TPA: serine/threonine-protein kinase [Kofleriaceae bacterium]|nr:serine/threonine-protein kinase [Kofleriaceae bacterium]HMG57515.1 serine/threonine-protein kinase [Kofleriaceae bacterium]
MTERTTDVLAPSAGSGPDRELLAIGSPVGSWRITSLIAAGGCGVVYAARHAVLERVAAVKVLHSALAASPAMVDRFVREARAVNHIKHPNIIDIFDFGALPDGRPFFVMELLEPGDLQQRIDACGRLTIAEVVAIMTPVCHALDAAHRAGYIHRDLKARNIGFAIAGDGRELVKLLDFGVAKLLEADREMTGTIRVGSPHCMSPEQIRGEPVDARTDVYALGVLLYHLLVGRYPFEAGNAAEIERLHLEAPPPVPSRFAPVPVAFDAIVTRALSKRPAERPGSVTEFLERVTAAAAAERIRRADAIAISVVLELPEAFDAADLEVAAAAAEHATEVVREHGFTPVLVTGTAVVAADLLGDDPQVARARAAAAAAATEAAIEAAIAAAIERAPATRPRVAAPVSYRIAVREDTAEVADQTGAFVGGPLLDLHTWPR